MVLGGDMLHSTHAAIFGWSPTSGFYILYYQCYYDLGHYNGQQFILTAGAILTEISILMTSERKQLAGISLSELFAIPAHPCYYYFFFKSTHCS